MSRYIDMHRGRFGVEPICQILDVSASAYYHRATGQRSPREVADEQLLEAIKTMHAANYYAYGYRKTSKALGRAGHDVGRDHVKRLMRQAGIQGRQAPRQAVAHHDPGPVREQGARSSQPRLHRQPPRRAVAGRFHVPALLGGIVFFSFVIDAFSRRIVGWQFASHMRTTLVLDALRMALMRRDAGADVQLVHHSDAGSQGGFKWSSQHLIERSCDGQAGWVDDGVDGQGADEVAGEAVASTRCGAVVLA